MATWIFQGNPDRFDIDGYLRAGLSRISWGVDRYLDRYRIGDVIYFWRAGGERRGVSGVVASGRINSDVWQGPSEPEAARFWTTPGDTGARQRVWVVVDKIANEKEIVKRDWLAEDPIFKDHPLFTVRVGTSFSLSQEQEERLRDLWRRTGIDWDRADIVAALYAYAVTRGREISKLPGSPVSQVALKIGRAIPGVYNKLMNLRAIDPSDERKGLTGGNRLDMAVWNEFFDLPRRELRTVDIEAEYRRLWEPQWSAGEERAYTQSIDIEAERLEEEHSLDTLLAAYAKRKASNGGKPRVGVASAKVFERSALVIAIAKRRAQHRCEVPGCDYRPFLTTDGVPFVEVHHLMPLASGGEDTIENVAAVCATHHRELHLGNQAALLTGKLQELRKNGG